MTPNDFITNLITDASPYILTTEDKKTIQFEGVDKYIYKKLNNSKYRASKTTPDYDQTVKEKIAHCVKNSLPIHIDLSTGATKGPRVITSPGIDWAEVFNIALFREFLKPIAAGYKQGIKLEYFSVAVFENKVNYIPQADVDLYALEFTHLIELYKKYLPANFELKFSQLAARGDINAILKAIDADIGKRKLTWTDLDETVRADKLRRAERNIYWTGEEKNREELIFLSALAHDSFVDECWVAFAEPVWYEEDDISFGHRNTDGWAIHVRSAQASTVNFWSGMGLLRKIDGGYLTDVLSPNQYEKIKKMFQTLMLTFFLKMVFCVKS